MSETNEKFVHLHNHSAFSVLDGLTSIENMVKCAKETGYKSLALTDHGTCAGLVQFQNECKEHGIKSILGMEAYITSDCSVKEKDTKSNHLVLLAKNKVGYHNLIRLSSLGYLEGFYHKPRIDFNLLRKHHEGLIVSSACCVGEIPDLLWKSENAKAEQVAGQYRDLFGDDFYLEIMMHTYSTKKSQEEREKQLAYKISDLSKKMNIKAICTNDCHYARKQEADTHDVLLSIQTHDVVKNPDRFTFGSNDFYLKSYEEMFALYKNAPDLLLNTVEISEKIENKLISTSDDLLPDFKVPEGFASGDAYLKSLIKEGMIKRGLYTKTLYKERIRYEMDVITKCKYTKYFLILWDIINFAKTNGIRVGAGRGSAVSSLILYCLGITQLDPIKYDLLFERFLNPDRVSPPDVDVDFDYNRREEVYNYIVNKYGQDRTSQIGTYNTFQAKACIKGVVKALDLGRDWEAEQKCKQDKTKYVETKYSLRLADEISKLIPKKAEGLADAMRLSTPFRSAMEKHPKLIECTQLLEGTLSSAGVHPAGIIVCKDPVIDHVPLRVSKGVLCSQYDGPEVEKIGLLKFDLLAIKTLTMLDNTVKMIHKRHGKLIDIDSLEPNDPKVFEIYNGVDGKNTLGLFQFESSGIAELLKNIRVNSFEDIIVANALYRPGPMGAGVHDLYCQYKHDNSKIKYLHPRMGEILKDSYGIMIYQESIMKVARELAGFTRGQSDTLRKAVGKKIPELLKEQRELFVNGCVKNNVTPKIAEAIFEQIDYFAGYGFNKSHAAAYSLISYQCAYLKTYYPIEFMCNLLTNEINNNDKNLKLNMYLSEARRLGIICKPQSINYSGLEFEIEKGIHEQHNRAVEVIRKPLAILDGIGEKAVHNIVNNKPYKSMDDFVRRIDRRVVNVRVVNALIASGCMDVWKESHDTLNTQYLETKKQLEKETRAKEKAIKKAEKDKDERIGSLFDGLDLDYSENNVIIEDVKQNKSDDMDWE